MIGCRLSPNKHFYPIFSLFNVKTMCGSNDFCYFFILDLVLGSVIRLLLLIRYIHLPN